MTRLPLLFVLVTSTFGCQRPPPPEVDAETLSRQSREIDEIDELHRTLDLGRIHRLEELILDSTESEVRQRALRAHTDVLIHHGRSVQARELLIHVLRGNPDKRDRTTAMAGLHQLRAADPDPGRGARVDAWIEGNPTLGQTVNLVMRGSSPYAAREARLQISKIEAMPGGEDAAQGLLYDLRDEPFEAHEGTTESRTVPLRVVEEGRHRIEVTFRLDVDEFDIREVTDEVFIDVGADRSAVRAVRRLVADRDGDGVLDALDHCLSTAAGHPVDDQGCDPVEQRSAEDRDQDGLPDVLESRLGGAHRADVRVEGGSVVGVTGTDGRHLVRRGAARLLFDAEATADDPDRNGLVLELSPREQAVGVWGLPTHRPVVEFDVPVGTGRVVCVEHGPDSSIRSATARHCPLSDRRSPCGDGHRVGVELPELGETLKIPGTNELGQCEPARHHITRISDRAVRVRGPRNGVVAVVD